jgi:hypothetical protein
MISQINGGTNLAVSMTVISSALPVTFPRRSARIELGARLSRSTTLWSCATTERFLF